MNKESLEFLVEASKVLNSTLDLGTLVSFIYDLIVASVDCETCSLAQLDSRDNTLRILIALGKTGNEVAGVVADRDHGVIGRVVATGKPLVTNTSGDLGKYEDPIDARFAFRKRNSAAVSLMRGGEVRGAIEAVNKAGGDFTDRDVEVLSALSEQIAIALDNATLYATSQREIRQRKLLYDVGVRISSSLDLSTVLDLILDSLQQVVQYEAGGIYLVDAGVENVINLTARGFDPDSDEALTLKFGQGIVGWVAKNVVPVIVGDVSKDTRYMVARERTRSEIVVPLVADGKIVGVLNLESDRSNAFGEDDLELIQAFGSQAAISIERAKLHAELLEKRRLEDEIELARKIQKTFLPSSLPRIPGYDLSALNIPSEEVGGDYYDVIPIAEGQWGLAVADVFGKGIPASLVMASFRASLLAEIRNNYAITTILAKVNRLIWESVEPERCVTACYGVLDVAEGVLTYANAGHVYPILVSRTGVRRLSSGGMLLGAFESETYEEERLHLAPGDLLLFFTDGLTEAVNRDGEAYGEARLVDLAGSLADLACPEIVERIYGEIWNFCEGLFRDDFTLLVIKVRRVGTGGIDDIKTGGN